MSTLTATAAGFSAVSALVNVTAGPAAKLAFTAEPAGGTGGSAFGTQPQVNVQDLGGNAVLGETRAVTIVLAQAQSPGAGALICPATKAVDGAATFSGCQIDKIGTYALTAMAVDATEASTTVTITVGKAVKLGFTAQPASGDRKADLTPQTVVAIQDAGGNAVTTGPSVRITLTLTPGVPGANLTCNSKTRTTSAGVATFVECRINKAAEHQLAASATGFTPLPARPSS